MENANKIAAAAESPNGTELQRSTRRALACYHGDLYDKDGFMKEEAVCEPKHPYPLSFS